MNVGLKAGGLAESIFQNAVNSQIPSFIHHQQKSKVQTDSHCQEPTEYSLAPGSLSSTERQRQHINMRHTIFRKYTAHQGSFWEQPLLREDHVV